MRPFAVWGDKWQQKQWQTHIALARTRATDKRTRASGLAPREPSPRDGIRSSVWARCALLRLVSSKLVQLRRECKLLCMFKR